MRGLVCGLLGMGVALAEPASDPAAAIHWLQQNGRALVELPFPLVIESATGKKVFPIRPETDREWLDALGRALDRSLARLNEPAHPIHRVGRINEASRFVEDEIIAELSAEPGWRAESAPTATGARQRSGYPDIRLRLPDGRTVYLDPKLMAAENRASTLRTFYYEPRTETTKVNDDAVHLLIGVQHEGETGANLRLAKWEIVDLSRVRLELKPEFQTGNRELYRDETVIRRSATPR